MENNIQTDTKESKTEKIILILFLNLMLLIVSTYITIEILNETHQVILLQESILIGMIIVPFLSLFVGIVVALLAWAIRLAKKFLYVVPVVPLSFVVGCLLVFFGPDWINSHLTHDQIYGPSKDSGVPSNMWFDAPGLNEKALQQVVPSGTSIHVEDVKPIANQSGWYWVNLNRDDHEKFEDEIAAFDQKGNHLSTFKTVDEIWTDMQKQQGVTLGRYDLSRVQWNLPGGEIVLVSEKEKTTEYDVYLKSDGEQVTIDHIVVKKQ